MEKGGPFEITKRMLTLSGVMEAGGRYRWGYRLVESVLWVSFVWIWVSLGVGIARALSGSEYVTLLEGVLYAVGTFHGASKFLVLRLRAPRVLAVIDRLEQLTARAAARYPDGDKIFARATSFADRFPKALVWSLVAKVSVSLGVGLYTGKPPYPAVWVPVENVESACVLQTVGLYLPAFYFAVPYSLFTSLTVNLSTHVSFLCRQFVDLSPSREDFGRDLAQCLCLHVEIIRIVEEINSTFSDLFFQEIFLSSVQCCVSGYLCTQQMKVLAKGNNVFCFEFFISTLMPFIICSCGERIKDMSSNISFAVYSSPWYLQSFSEKKSIRIMMTAAYEPLRLHYKNLICFDFIQYSLMLQTAYSYFTVLQSLELE